jgi:hypothetical protein
MFNLRGIARKRTTPGSCVDTAKDRMCTKRRLFAVLVVLLGALATGPAGCSVPSQACYPSDYQACSCDGGQRGLQQCTAAGDGYGACDCSGVLPGADGSAATDGGGEGGSDGGLLPFLAPCSSDAQCVTGHCFPFNAKGPHCSQPCTTDQDCPAPSPGCSGMGVCKVS